MDKTMAVMPSLSSFVVMQLEIVVKKVLNHISTASMEIFSSTMITIEDNLCIVIYMQHIHTFIFLICFVIHAQQ